MIKAQRAKMWGVRVDRQRFVVEMHNASYNTTLFKHRLLEKILHFMHSTYFQLKQKPDFPFLNLYLYQRYGIWPTFSNATQLHETLIQTWQYEDAQMEENPFGEDGSYSSIWVSGQWNGNSAK